MFCTVFDGNPCAEPCPDCASKYIVLAESLNEDPLCCCFETKEEAKACNAKAEVTHCLSGIPIIPKSNIMMIPKKERKRK